MKEHYILVGVWIAITILWFYFSIRSLRKPIPLIGWEVNKEKKE